MKHLHRAGFSSCTISNEIKFVKMWRHHRLSMVTCWIKYVRSQRFSLTTCYLFRKSTERQVRATPDVIFLWVRFGFWVTYSTLPKKSSSISTRKLRIIVLHQNFLSISYHSCYFLRTNFSSHSRHCATIHGSTDSSVFFSQ